MKNFQKVFFGSGKKAVISRFSPGCYSVAYFNDPEALKSFDVVDYEKLSWARADAEAFIRS